MLLSSITALNVARFQFAFAVTVHIIFPPLTIGLSVFLLVLEGLWLKTKKSIYQKIYKFWIKIFAVNFGLGVISGVFLSFQIGQNWSQFSNFAGPVIGPLMSYEVLTAFFLESGFLGIMLFGIKKVSRCAHFFATIMVTIGTLLSSFWIMAANSWMQTPRGFTIIDGIIHPTNWIEIIFNPSFPYHLIHMLLTAFICTSLTIAGTAAWHLLQNTKTPAIKSMFTMSISMLFYLVPLQIYVGHQHSRNTLIHQPAKIAAIEGNWETKNNGTSFYVFGIPDTKQEKTHYTLKIPYLSSLLLTHSLKGKTPNLKNFIKENRPTNIFLVFWSFRVMVLLGLLMMLLATVGFILHLKKQLFKKKWFYRWTLIMAPSGHVALIAGWIVTEVGRQPWVVYGIQRTTDAVSTMKTQKIGVTLAILLLVDIIIFGIGSYTLLTMMKTDTKGYLNKKTRSGR